MEGFSWSFGVLVITLLLIAVAVVAIIWMKYQANAKSLKVHHDVSGFVFANLGVLYAVLLGFTVVNVQDHFNKVNQTIMLEAGYLAELYRDAEAFSESDKKALRSALTAYGKSIIDDEWEIISEGKAHPETDKKLSNLWNIYYDIELSSRKQEILYAESIHRLNESTMARLERFVQGKETLGDEMWAMLILGGILIVGFVSIFSFEILWLHLLLLTSIAASIGFLLMLIYSLDTAFSGTIRVTPEALQSVLAAFQAS